MSWLLHFCNRRSDAEIIEMTGLPPGGPARPEVFRLPIVREPILDSTKAVGVDEWLE